MTDIREIFEEIYSDRFGINIEDVKSARLGDNSYDLLTTARCFRFFCAGYEAAQIENTDKTGDNHEQ